MEQTIIIVLIVLGMVLLFLGKILDRDWISWIGGFLFTAGFVLQVQELLESYGFVPGA